VLLIRRTVRPRGYASGPSLAAALVGKRRVLARQGWAGEKVRAWGTHPSHPGDNVHEQAWKDHHWSLAATLPVERRVLSRRAGRVRPAAFLNSLRALLEPSVAFYGRVFSSDPNGL
jgi:hypothetical protein